MRRLQHSVGFRFLTLFIITALFLPLFSWAQIPSEAKTFQDGQARPVPGKPEATLPSVQEARQRQFPAPATPPAIPSTIRSERNPLAPRNGRTVSDPVERTNSEATASVAPIKRSRSRNPRLSASPHSHHVVRSRAYLFSPSPTGDDQYIQGFFQTALVRLPHADESTYWDNILRAAYAHGQSSMIMAVRELGKTLFDSAQYRGRSRNNSDYVSDLYWAYFLHAPDSGGLTYWAGQVGPLGREAVRRAFDESSEFFSAVATITPNGSAGSNVSSLLTKRLDGFNQPGGGLLSRDAEWTLPIISLPGRAGLDLGLGLSYSSAVWTQSGPYIYFDDDNGWPSPGFRLGFPVVQELLLNAQSGQNAYLLITSSGSRVELRQVGSSSIYETSDSSYLQLTDNGTSLLLRSTDGTQMSYTRFSSEWRCTKIQDRNGNFITVNYDWLGHITTIVDTLNRTISFNYDQYANPTSITQTWNGQSPPHEWATFGWGTKTLNASFPSVAIVGAKNTDSIPVLTQVGLADGTHYNFEYTDYLQASIFRRYSADNVQRAYTAIGYTVVGDDWPRIANLRQWADNWTGINGLPTEVVTAYADLGNVSHYVTYPDGTIYQEYYDGTGWQRGLVTRTYLSSGGVLQKWSTTTWTQDNTTLSYPVNPRVTESNLYDSAGNRRKSGVGYTASAPYLPVDVSEYDAGNNYQHVYRRTHTDYVTDSAYVNQKRLIGLPSSVTLYDANNVAQSKKVYSYDLPSNLQALPGNENPQQHDPAYNDTNLTTRGNLTSIQRISTDPNDPPNTKTETQFGYNIAGSVTFSQDANSHQNSMGYADSFSDATNHHTFAYPTSFTDGDGKTSSVQYNYDFGATTRTQGPTPAGQLQGLIQTTTYDNAGRVDRLTTVNNGAYVRFMYGVNDIVKLATVNNVADESFTHSVYDGMGRLIAIANDNPGSLGGYKAQWTQYDQMGRAMKQSNPTEIDGWWNPYGDDAAGAYYTQQTYDWKGRPLRTTHPDTTYKEAAYTGCGCAGGEVTTLTDEGTIDAGAAKKRQQKIYADLFGRTVKTEILNWAGGAVYSSVVNTYNVRDQVTQVRQYAGPEGSVTYQDTTTAYDGYGRLKTQHRPEQSSGTATTWEYNNDDTVYKITEARGATATFTGYNGRHLPGTITHALSGSSTIVESILYDDAGNRTKMTDAKGHVDYAYDQLSRLTSENRFITGISNPLPSPDGAYKITYGYNLQNEVTGVTDAFNSTTTLTYDTAGRTSSVTGLYGGVNYNYATNIKYRAWGAVKAATFNNIPSPNPMVSYNARMQPTQFRLGSNYMRYDYSYYDDGHLRQLMDLDDQMLQRPFHYMAREYSYDHAGRIGSVGGAPNHGGIAAPLTGTYAHDQFNNLIGRSGHYALFPDQSDGAPYTNNRRVQTGWSYNAEGQLLTSSDTSDAGGSSTRNWTYDAAGKLVTVSEVRNGQTTTNNLAYDGDGQLLYELVSGSTSTSDYLIRSTVLGTVLTKLDINGGKNTTYVPTNGLVMPLQQKDWQGNPIVSFSYRDQLGLQQDGQAYDPFGNLIYNVDPPQSPPATYVPFYGATWGGASWNSFSNANNMSTGCILDGRPADCNRVQQLFNDGGIQWDVPSGLTDSTRYTPQQVPNYFETRGEQGSRFFVTGSVFSEPEPQNPFDDPGIERTVFAAIASKPCQNFAKTVLDAQKRKGLGSLNDVAKAFFALNGPHFTRNRPRGSTLGIGNPIGRISRGTAQIYSLGNNPDLTANQQMLDDADVAIGELFHLAAQGEYYSDEELAIAVHNSSYATDAYEHLSSGQPRIDPRSNMFDPTYIPDKKDPYDRAHSASKYFHTIQNKYCTAKPGFERGVGFTP